MDKTIKLVEKEIRKLEYKLESTTSNNREKRKKIRMQIILFNEELDMLYRRYKKVEEF